jgi:TM2 domain-containing membrane protein YozV
MGFGLRLGPVRINKRGISLGAGIGLGPIGVGGGVRVAKFGRSRSSRNSSSSNFLFLELIIAIVRPIDKLLQKLENRTKKYFKKSLFSRWLLFFICLFLGFFGVHRFITGKVRTGIYFYLTAGGFLIGVVVDLVQIFRGKYRDVWDRPLKGTFLDNLYLPIKKAIKKSQLLKQFKTFGIARKSFLLFLFLAETINISNILSGSNSYPGLIFTGVVIYFVWNYKAKS